MQFYKISASCHSIGVLNVSFQWMTICPGYVMDALVLGLLQCSLSELCSVTSCTPVCPLHDYTRVILFNDQ